MPTGARTTSPRLSDFGAQTCAQRRLAHRNREPALGDHPLRIFDEVQPGEPQLLPAQKRDLVLPLSIMLEGGLIIVNRPAVGPDSDPGRWKGDVDFIAADAVVRSPAGDARRTQKLD